MKISEITQGLILSQLRESEQALSADDLALIDAYKQATIRYMMDWTGIKGIDSPDSQGHMLDDYDDLIYPFMAIISFMYDNRQFTVDKDKINPIAASTLNLHSFNFVPSDDTDSGDDPEVSV